MNKQGQMSIFLILGLVILITIISLILLVSRSQPPEQQPDVTVDEALVSSCLSASTQAAVAQLQEKEFLYNGGHAITTHNTLALGFTSTRPLCNAQQGPNQAGSGFGGFSCTALGYAGRGESVQELLADEIYTRMLDCAEQEAPTEVIIQRQGAVVRWGDFQHSSSAPLLSAWTAKKEFLSNEVRDPQHNPATPTTLRGCLGCQVANITQTTEADGTKYYELTIDDSLITTFSAENRGIIEVIEDYEFTSEPAPLDCDFEEDTSCERTIISVDGDELELTGVSQDASNPVLELKPKDGHEWVLRLNKLECEEGEEAVKESINAEIQDAHEQTIMYTTNNHVITRCEVEDE